jgi:galactokinase
MDNDDLRTAELRAASGLSFGAPPDLLVRSPGRVNLIGEHTDYNDGFTLPIALNLGTDVAVRRRPDGLLRTFACRLDASDTRRLDALHPTEGPEWARYIAGAAAGIDRTELARLGQRIENEIIGLRSGIMDQLAIACAEAGSVLLIDCRTLATEPVPLPGGMRILVLDSAVPRTLAGSAYNTRRAECEAALQRLQDVVPRLRAHSVTSPPTCSPNTHTG